MTPASGWPWPVTAMGGDTRVLRPRAHLFREGDAAVNVFEIVHGAVRSCKIFADGRRQVVSFGFAGDIVGFGQGATYRFDCETLVETRVRVISRIDLMRALRVRPDLGERLLEIAAGQVASLQDLSILLCRKSALERIATFLVGMVERHPSALAGGRIPLPMGRADIGDFLGLTIETVSRGLTRLKAMRLIDLPDRGGFAVPNLAALRALAEGEGGLH
jgi:CRP-like cAMP-binding protein